MASVEPPGEPLLTCACGSQWFELREGIGAQGGKYAGAVALNESGSVAAYSALLACIECGEFRDLPEPRPDAPSLRLVENPRAASQDMNTPENAKRGNE